MLKCVRFISRQYFYAICHIKFRLHVYKLTFISRGGGYGDGMTAVPDGRQARFCDTAFQNLQAEPLYTRWDVGICPAPYVTAEAKIFP